MTEWIIEVNDGQEVLGRDDGLYDVVVSDTFNPFGNYAKGFFDDAGGELFDIFRRGVKVSFQYSNDNTNGFEQRFVGYVVNDLAKEADGAEQVEAEAYTFDQFLRGDEVSNDQTGNTVFEALEDVITTDVPPVNWDASLVEVQNDVELTQSFQGERVEEFILAVRQKSAGEIFGVDENLNFFFEPSEISRTRRDIDNSQWVTHDIGEESGETKNQATVYFDDGNRAVTVDDTGDQLRLQDNLGAGGPGQEGESITRDEITNIEDAIDAGEAYLEGRAATLTGPVTTFDLNSAQPGDVIGVTIEPRGIEGDFRIAENRMQWRSETNELTVVAKKGADDDILIEQSKTLDRVEGRPRDTSVIPDRVTDSLVQVTLSVSGDANGVAFETTRVTNICRNLIRDSWIDKGTLNITTFGVSTSDRRPSRSDASLPSVAAQTTISQSLPDDFSVQFSGSVSASGIQLVGLRNRRDELIAVGKLPEPVDDPTITMEITVDNPTQEFQSAIVQQGQTTTRDIIADTQPDYVDEYAFGSDPTDVTELDTTISTVATNELDAATIQAFDGTGLHGKFEIPDDAPLAETSAGVELVQSTFGTEIESLTSDDIVTDVAYSNGEAVEIAELNPVYSYTFAPEYTIPAENVVVGIRFTKSQDTGDPVTFDIRIDGTVVGSLSVSPTTPGSMEWESLDFFDNEFDLDGVHELELVLTTTGSDLLIADYMYVADDRYQKTASNLDNSVHQDGGYLDDPKLYPSAYPAIDDYLTLPAASTDISMDNVGIIQVWSDTTNNQSIEITPGGQTDNNQVATADYTDRVTDVQVGVIFSRYPVDGTNPQSATPRYGYEGQSLSSHEITADLDAIQRNEIGEVLVRSFTGPDTANTETFAEGGQQSDGTLITHVRVPEFTKQSGQRVVSSERLRWINDPEN